MALERGSADARAERNMESVRQQLLRLFPIQVRGGEPDGDVAAAIYGILLAAVARLIEVKTVE